MTVSEIDASLSAVDSKNDTAWAAAAEVNASTKTGSDSRDAKSTISSPACGEAGMSARDRMA